MLKVWSPRTSVLRRQKVADLYAQKMAQSLKEAVDACGDQAPLSELAAWLNSNGFHTRLGNPWNGKEVARLIERLSKLLPDS